MVGEMGLAASEELMACPEALAEGGPALGGIGFRFHELQRGLGLGGRSVEDALVGELHAMRFAFRAVGEQALRGELGGFIVKHVETGIEFRLGYNHVVGGVDRVSLWQQRSTLLGRMVKFKHQPSGAKEAPRFPKFIGFRELWDLS